MFKRSSIITVIFALSCAVAVASMSLPDSFYRGMKLGEYVARNMELPPPGALSYLPAESGWWDASWLFHTTTYLIYHAAGMSGMRLSMAVLAVLTALLLCLAAFSGGVRRDIAALTMAAALVAIFGNMELGPELPGLAMFACQTLLLDRWRYGESKGSLARKSAILFVFLALWSQLDKSCLGGLVYLWAFMFFDGAIPRKSRFLLMIVALLGFGLSPTGMGFFTPASQAVLMTRTADFHLNFMRLQAFMVLSGFCSVAFLKERSGRAAGLLAMAVMGLASGAYLPLAVISALPLISTGVERLSERARLLSWRGVVFAVALVIVLSLPALSWGRGAKDGAVELMNFIERRPFFGGILAPPELGGRIAWITGRKMAFDGRPAAYSAPSLKLYARLYDIDGEGWRKIMGQYGVGGVITGASDPEYGQLADLKTWALAFENKDYALFVLDEKLNSALLDKWGRKAPSGAQREEKPRDAARRLTMEAKEWEERGNPYRAIHFLMDAAKLDPLGAGGRAAAKIGALEKKIREREGR